MPQTCSKTFLSPPEPTDQCLRKLFFNYKHVSKFYHNPAGEKNVFFSSRLIQRFTHRRGLSLEETIVIIVILGTENLAKGH